MNAMFIIDAHTVINQINKSNMSRQWSNKECDKKKTSQKKLNGTLGITKEVG